MDTFGEPSTVRFKYAGIDFDCAMKRAQPWLVIVGLFLSGCLGTTDRLKSPADGSPEPSFATPATVTAETGGLEGVVTDPELVPLGRVEVVLKETKNATMTDDAGRYSFSNLNPGPYSLFFQLAGYESVGRKADVVAGEVVQADAILAPLPAAVPRVELMVFEGYIQFGEAYTDIITASTGGLVGCQKCLFYFNVTESAVALVFEIKFTPTIANPTGPTTLGYQFTDAGASRNYMVGSWESGDKRQLNKTWPQPGGRFYHLNYCDDLWICVDQRFTVYVSHFHYVPPSSDYSALPKG